MRRSRAVWLVVTLTLIAFALRVYRLDFFSLRGDESFTVLFVLKPLAQMWHETLTVEPNPPLLYLLLRGWVAVAGTGEFAARFFSVFFGVLCVPLGGALGRAALRSRAAGLIGAVLIAINPYQVWHSQDVRNYTLWPALSLLALVLFWRWHDSREARVSARALVLFVAAELVALYSHYYEALTLLALNLFVFATVWRDRRKLVHWLGAQLALAVLYLPYPLILSNRVSAYGEGSGRQGVALWDIARETLTSFTLGDTLDPSWRAWLWIAFALVAVAGLVALFARDRRRALWFALYVGVPTLAVFALNTVRPLYLERYLNGIAPAYYLLAAYALARGAQWVAGRVPARRASFARRATLAGGLALALLVAAPALSNYWTNPAYAKAPDWRGLAQLIAAQAQPGDLIIQNFPETSLVYYDRTRLPLVVYPETFLPNARTTQQLSAMNSNYLRAWFIPAAPDVWDPDQFVESWLDHRDDLLEEWNVGEFRLRRYATPSLYLNAMTPVGARMGDSLRLNGYRTERRGSDLRVVLYWRVTQNPAHALDVELTALSAADVLTAVREPPVRGAYPATEWRQNELVVDQHDLPGAAAATEVFIRVCTAGVFHCLTGGNGSPVKLAVMP